MFLPFEMHLNQFRSNVLTKEILYIAPLTHTIIEAGFHSSVYYPFDIMDKYKLKMPHCKKKVDQGDVHSCSSVIRLGMTSALSMRALVQIKSACQVSGHSTHLSPQWGLGFHHDSYCVWAAVCHCWALKPSLKHVAKSFKMDLIMHLIPSNVFLTA